ncbi:hypothetical protein BS50DRAFT_52701 [Corynespora cassiicola Philippines]|uniref:Uncharacterized protein n=1 Tax=Corynespora cassiicola Philippines TaxID=1448308 RepID=A0A2T2NIA3_CORCC|nr:hypothetical protein BS50DRAFT_52701 [Corynespora cassiicola Philippines]
MYQVPQPSLSHNFWYDSSDIEELVIETSHADVNMVAVMLEAIRKLKRFEMPVHEDEFSFKNEWVYSDWLGWIFGRLSFDYDPETMTHPALVQGLYRHRDTLKSLDIDGGISDHDTTNTLGFNGFLHYFHRLKHLVAPFGAIAGTRCPTGPEFVESLPVTLESLKIVIRSFDADDDKVKQKDLGRMEPIEYLAENFQSQVPHLKSVMVVCEIKSSEFEYEWERLRTPFFERGVRFDFEQYGKDELDELFPLSPLPKPDPWWPIRGRTIEFDTDDSDDMYGGESDFDGFVFD